jgi:Spy/CpxP family protein refolding chaperone
MKLLQTFVVAGLLTGTACQQIPPKTENVSVETGSMVGTVARADVDNPAATQLDPGVKRLKEQLSLTEQQTQELDKVFKDARAKREVLTTKLREISKTREDRMNAVLTKEQREIYEQKRWEVPEHPGKPERSEP